MALSARFPTHAERRPLPPRTVPNPPSPASPHADTIDPQDTIDDQDQAHGRIHDLLTAVTEALLDEQPQLISFTDHRSERDRPSGAAWRGLETMCHISALLVSARAPDMFADAVERLLACTDDAARAAGLTRRAAEPPVAGIHRAVWERADGDRLELVIGVRLSVRAISSPFLPGSLHPLATTSPPSPLSPLTPPPRPPR